MSKTICSQETAVAEAVRAGRWNDSLEAHLAGCARCGELLHTVRAMQSLALTPNGETTMPEASWLWCRALLEQKQQESRRIRRKLATVEYTTTVLLVLGSVGWLAWSWPKLESLLTGWQANLWAELWRAAWFLAERTPMLASLPSAAVLALLLAAAAFLLAQPLLAED